MATLLHQSVGKNMLQQRGWRPAGMDKTTFLGLFWLNLLPASEPYFDSYRFSA